MSMFTNNRLLLRNEISLEGLDGITFQALWLRIAEVTKVKLPLPQSLEAEYWKIICQSPDFSFYELKEPREDLVIYDRFSFIDSECDNTYFEPDELPVDIYPHKPVQDAETGIRGSCATYRSREDITDIAKSTPYLEAKERWGSKLVIVASQECREEALIGTQSFQNIDLNLTQYCLLERIGRSRYHGEITQGKRSLQTLGEDPKTLFYHRKALVKYKLVAKQVYHQKCGVQNFSGTLLHLQKYYTERKPKPLILTEQVVELLRTKPNFIAEYKDVSSEIMNKNAMKKLFKSPEFQRFVRTDIKVPYRKIYPEATMSEWKHKHADKEKTLRCMELIDPEVDVAENWCKVDENDEEEETGFQDYPNLCYGVSLLSQAAAIVRNYGPNGCSQTELGEIMGQSKLNARSFCRNLLRRNAVSCIMNDVGRQRVTRFVSRRHENNGAMTIQFKQERDKMMSLISSVNSNKNQKNTKDETLDDDDLLEIASDDLDSISESSKQKLEEDIISEDMNNIKSNILLSQSEENLINIEEKSIISSISDQKSEQNEDISGGISVEPPNKKQCLEQNQRNKKRTLSDADTIGQPTEKKQKCESAEKLNEHLCVDQIEVKMTVAKAIPGLKGCSQGLTEQLKQDILSTASLNSTNVTYRLLKRANFIIESVRQEKVIADLTKLMKMIHDEENDEGYNVKIDKKSLIRLLLKLAKDGYVKYIKATLRTENKEKGICFICDPSIDENHSVIQSALEQAKMKFYIESKPLKTQSKRNEIEKDAAFDTELVNQVRQELQEYSTASKIEYQYDRKAGRKNGLCPKFVRMRIIHELLFYLIYETPQEPITKSSEIDQFFRDHGYLPEDVKTDQINTIYHRDIGWKMFIPPIPTHVGWPKGWTLICDVLLRLPLSLFMKCFNVPFKIDGIEHYLSHPVRKHYLVKHLPSRMRNGLMFHRKYIFAMHEIISRLCYNGLLQFGPQRLKEKDQVFIYLNRKASLYNTAPSLPGYHEISDMDYEKHNYYFETFQDIDQYWYELWTTCMNTNLGSRLCVTGQYIVLEQLHTKQCMIDASLPRLPHEAASRDNGEIPGDKKGAAGLDSAFFAHLKRNWNWTSSSAIFSYNSKPPEYRKKSNLVKICDPKNPEKTKQLIVKKHVVTGTSKTLNKIKKNSPKSDTVPKKYKATLNISSKKKVIRKVVAIHRKQRKPFYDDVDKEALKKMDKLRTDWSSLEDHVVLLCTVGSKYLCPNRRRQMISFAIIRDVLHKMVTTSLSKTSRACQRRISYIMKNINTRRSVNMCLEEVLQNVAIAKKYGQIAKRTLTSHIPEIELNIAFVDLVADMSKMFTNLIETEKKEIHIPNCIKKFRENFHISSSNKKAVVRFKDPQNIHDININTIKTIIHSSMCCTKDKTSWAYQLFKVYQQYPETLLRSVISRIRHEQMISLRKSYIKSHKSGSYMPLSSSPYQLSISYKHQLLSKYPQTIYQEAFEFLQDTSLWLNEKFSKESEINEFLVIQNPKSGSAAGLIEMTHKLNVDFKFEIPEQVIVLDPKIENDSAYDRIIKRYQDILRDPTSFKSWVEQQKSQLDSDDDEDNFPDFDSNDYLKKNEITFNSPRPSTRIAFYMMRAEMCEGVDEKGKAKEHMHDFFVVNASKVLLNLPNISNECETLGSMNIYKDLLPITPKICTELIAKIKCDAVIPDICPSETEIIKYLESYPANEYDLEFAIKIINYLEECGSLGATIKELIALTPEPFTGCLNLQEILDALTELKVIIRTGVEKIRYIHFEHKKPWIINSFKILRLDREKMQPHQDINTDKPSRHKKNYSYVELQKSKQRLDLKSQQAVKVLISPWIRIDGSLNRRVLDRYLGSVLMICLDHPGITLEVLSHKYPYMKPVDTISLVGYLTTIKCVNQFTVRKSKTTLFSSLPSITIVPATGTEDPKEIYVEPSCDAVLRLAVFIGEKAYSSDFLT